MSDDMSVCPECGSNEGWDCIHPRTKDCGRLLRCRSCQMETVEDDILTMGLF